MHLVFTRGQKHSTLIYDIHAKVPCLSSLRNRQLSMMRMGRHVAQPNIPTYVERARELLRGINRLLGLAIDRASGHQSVAGVADMIDGLADGIAIVDHSLSTPAALITACAPPARQDLSFVLVFQGP